MNFNTSFVEVETVYSNKAQQLNVDYLSEVYDDIPRLREIIKRIISPHLTSGIVQGKSVLLKPNWVKHPTKEQDKLSLCTNEHFILAALEEVLLLKPSRVLVADAPVNTCKWEHLLTKGFLETVEHLQSNYAIPITIKDFRRTYFLSLTGESKPTMSDDNEYVFFDVGERSLLEDITTEGKNKFRVTDYNPNDMQKAHHKGVHRYCITKDFFESDVIITLPKMKTHQKTGFTNALKILIGINGDKQYLPHHRLGASNHGGDCYKDYKFLASISEYLSDWANRNPGKSIYPFLRRLAAKSWKYSHQEKGMSLAAGWYGNDTIWRTVIDIQTIAQYGFVNGDGLGLLSDTIQRKVYSLCDGIIGGCGNGPLHPSPLPLGVVAFSDNPYAMDVVGGVFFSMNIDRIPLLKHAKKEISNSKITYIINGKESTLEMVKELSVNAQMPDGWIHYND